MFDAFFAIQKWYANATFWMHDPLTYWYIYAALAIVVLIAVRFVLPFRFVTTGVAVGIAQVVIILISGKVMHDKMKPLIDAARDQAHEDARDTGGGNWFKW